MPRPGAGCAAHAVTDLNAAGDTPEPSCRAETANAAGQLAGLVFARLVPLLPAAATDRIPMAAAFAMAVHTAELLPPPLRGSSM